MRLNTICDNRPVNYRELSNIEQTPREIGDMLDFSTVLQRSLDDVKLLCLRRTNSAACDG